MVGKRFVKIIEFLFPGKSRQFVADTIGVSNEARIRLYESGSVPETPVLQYFDRAGISVEWLLLNKGKMLLCDRSPESKNDVESTVDLPPVVAVPQPNAIRRRGDQDAEHPIVRLPVIGDVAARESGGTRSGMFDDGEPFWDDVEIPETTHMVKVRGDSMEPMIMDGQYAMVGPEYRVALGDAPKHREIVVAEIIVNNPDMEGSDSPYEGVFCKRVQDGESAWHFSSINPTGEAFTIAKEDCRLWPVVGVWFAGRGRPPKED